MSKEVRHTSEVKYGRRTISVLVQVDENGMSVYATCDDHDEVPVGDIGWSELRNQDDLEE